MTRKALICSLMLVEDQIKEAGWDRLAALVSGDRRAAQHAFDRQMALYAIVQPLRNALACTEDVAA